MKQEKMRRILDNYYKESKKEIHSLIQDKRYKKILNSIGEKIYLKDLNKSKFNSTFLKKIEDNESIKI